MVAENSILSEIPVKRKSQAGNRPVGFIIKLFRIFGIGKKTLVEFFRLK
jgi:hypothetical protein